MAASRGGGAVAVLLLLVLVLAPPAALVESADDDAAHLHFFMHDVVSGSDPTSVQVIKGPGSSSSSATAAAALSFGDTRVIDDALTEASAPSSAPVGRMQGVYVLASQAGAALMVTANILLTAGDYNGSTLAVMGRDDTAADVREISVVGGTGKFRMASGYVQWKTAAVSGPDSTFELHVYLGNGTNTTDDGSSDDGSGTGSSSGGSKSSSGATSVTTTVSAAGWAVAAAAAVVGSVWVW